MNVQNFSRFSNFFIVSSKKAKLAKRKTRKKANEHIHKTWLIERMDKLECPVCMCLFENPVSLLCGHSVCLDCGIAEKRNGKTTTTTTFIYIFIFLYLSISFFLSIKHTHTHMISILRHHHPSIHPSIIQVEINVRYVSRNFLKN